MSCDICKTTKGELHQLLDCYKSDTVSHVCYSCLNVINEHQRKLRDVTHNILVAWVRRFIANLKAP